eukprot:3438987-Lingulodinium_polyedra.AAC.1
MQAVTSFATKRGKQIQVEANESISELSWDDPIPTRAMDREFPPENYEKEWLTKWTAWIISRSMRRS